MKSSLGRPTKAERERIEKMRPLGCVACAHAGWFNQHYLELHHLLESGRRISHAHSILLCRGHHRNIWEPVQILCLLPRYRTSIASGTKSFNAVFGSDRRLWERVQVTINDPTEWPSSKILPRRVCP